jgi:hypothetical protein
MRRILIGLFSLCLLNLAVPASADVDVRMNSGKDDLRGGNSAFIHFILADGSSTPEQRISGGLNSFQRQDVRLPLPESVRAGNVRGFVIRHDGNPRNGQPFDTYDNWDLRFLTIQEHGGRTIYDQRFDAMRFSFVHRFTGESREEQINLIAPEGEPDFVIANARRVPGRVEFNLRNQGTAPGRATGLVCRGAGGSLSSRPIDVTLRSGETSTTVSMTAIPARSAICYVTGVAGETVTANNGRTLP